MQSLHSIDEPVGFIGIGAMGLAMARNLRSHGHAVWVRDIDPTAEQAARDDGMRVCATPAELAGGCRLVIVVVVDAAQIDSVLFGVDGVAQARARVQAQPQIVMLCSTIAPDDTRRFAERLAAHDIATIDAPISGGPARALAGTMSMMISAPDSVLAPWRPLLAVLASRRFELGERIGDAAKAKLVNNLLAGINLVAGAEALALAGKLGLDPARIFEVICASSGASWVFEDRMARALQDDFEPRAAAHILTKDMTLATALAAAAGHETPLGDAALARFREAIARGLGSKDDAVVIDTYRHPTK